MLLRKVRRKKKNPPNPLSYVHGVKGTRFKFSSIPGSLSCHAKAIVQKF
jgi:hypothetical protein